MTRARGKPEGNPDRPLHLTRYYSASRFNGSPGATAGAPRRSAGGSGRAAMEEAYREDLAYIHDAGFGRLARGAAGLLLDELHRCGFDRGLVIDLGCGSGILSEQLSAGGFDVLCLPYSSRRIVW